jgi:hypothetical protein
MSQCTGPTEKFQEWALSLLFFLLLYLFSFSLHFFSFASLFPCSSSLHCNCDLSETKLRLLCSFLALAVSLSAAWDRMRPAADFGGCQPVSAYLVWCISPAIQILWGNQEF